MKVSWRYFAGVIAGGFAGVAYCESDWPPLVLIAINVAMCIAWHEWAKTFPS